MPREIFGKRNSENPGSMKPMMDGPRKIPATISPTTDGWFIFVKIAPNNFETKRIVSICNSNKPKGLLILLKRRMVIF